MGNFLKILFGEIFLSSCLFKVNKWVPEDGFSPNLTYSDPLKSAFDAYNLIPLVPTNLT